MNAKQKRVLQSFRRAQSWLAARPELTTTAPNRPQLATDAPVPSGSATGSTPSALGEHVAALDTVVESVTSLAAEQETHRRGSKGSTAEATRLRAELLEQHIRPVADLAKLAIPDIVRMTEALRRPKARIDAEGLLAAADAMAKASAEFAEVLVQRGLPADFVAQLQGAAEDYRGAIDAGGEARGSRHGATEGLHDALGRGRKIVAALTVLVTRTLRTAPQALAEWRQMSRVTLKGVQPDVSARTQPAAVEPATVTPEQQKAA